MTHGRLTTFRMIQSSLLMVVCGSKSINALPLFKLTRPFRVVSCDRYRRFGIVHFSVSRRAVVGDGKTIDNDDTINAEGTITGTSSTTDIESTKLSKLAPLLKASRLGLDPSKNRFHAPTVYHENYSFSDWPPNHTFPMDKFERIAYALQTTCRKTVPTSNLPRPLIRNEEEFFRPLDIKDIPIKEWIEDIMMEEEEEEEVVDEEQYFDDKGTKQTTKNGSIHRQQKQRKNFVRRFVNGQLTKEEARYIGFREQVYRPELIERTLLEVAGTVLTAQLACYYGIACNVAGGTHHASPSGGAGYTIINDLAVATNFVTTEHLLMEPTRRLKNKSDEEKITYKQFSLLEEEAYSVPFWNENQDTSTKRKKTIEKVLVIDCDVHQGDGTSKFNTLWNEQNDYRLSTLSIHCASNYPQYKAHSTYDIGLRDGCTDDEYMNILQESVRVAMNEVRPDLILYDAGVDVYVHDKLRRINLSEENGIRRRDRWILEHCITSGIPIAAVVGGGYDKYDIDALARRHAIVHEECAYVWRKYQMWKQ